MFSSFKLLIILTLYYKTSFTLADESFHLENDRAQVQVNVNHIIDFLQSIKKSQDDMAQKIEILTKSMDSTDREEHKTRSKLSRKISALENKVAELEKTLPFKMEEIVRNKLLSRSNLASIMHGPSSSFSLNTGRSSRDIAYYEPYLGVPSSRSRSNYLRSPKQSLSEQIPPPSPLLPSSPPATALFSKIEPPSPSIGDRNGYLNVQLLEQSQEKINEFNETLEVIKLKISNVEKTVEMFNTSRFGNENSQTSSYAMEEKIASNIKEVATLRQKQSELQRAIDTVVIHFSAIMRGLEEADKKIEETYQNVTEEIKRHIKSTSKKAADNLLSTDTVSVERLQSPWVQNPFEGPAASALLFEKDKSTTTVKPPFDKDRGQKEKHRTIQSDQILTTDLSELMGNLTEEFKVQKQQISILSSELAKVNVSQILLMRTMDEETLKVLCDLQTEGGGWTIIQRRGYPLKFGKVRENFFRNWTEYEKGFGSLDGDFWLGLSKIASLSKLGDQELRIEMTKWNGETSFASYKHFKVSDAINFYKLFVSGYSGDAGDSLSRHNAMAFSTMDRDNDSDPQRNCAQMWKGAWWYYGCHESNLNGLYAREGSEGENEFGTGIIWYHWTGNYYSLKSVQMKMRNNFLVRNAH